MPAHSSYILQPLDVSCFAPLKKAYSRQIESKMRLSNNHITKAEFLPAFHIAHQQAMTAETILAGFTATSLVPFDPEKILQNLDSVIQLTPSLSKGSQSSWESKTLKTFPEIKKQAALIQRERRKRRRSSASLSDQHFTRLLKGFETAVYDRAILMAENASLRAENQYQKQKRARYKGSIQKGGSLTIQEGLEMVQSSVVIEQSVVEAENAQVDNPVSQLKPAAKRARLRCSKCGSYEHNARVCSL